MQFPPPEARGEHAGNSRSQLAQISPFELRTMRNEPKKKPESTSNYLQIAGEHLLEKEMQPIAKRNRDVYR